MHQDQKVHAEAVLNIEGQGAGGRTHLVSPMMAAAAAIMGRFTDVRTWEFKKEEVPA